MTGLGPEAQKKLEMLPPEAQKKFREEMTKKAKHEGQDPNVLMTEVLKGTDSTALTAKFDPKSQDFTPLKATEEANRKAAAKPQAPKPKPELSEDQKKQMEKDLTLFMERHMPDKDPTNEDHRAEASAVIVVFNVNQHIEDHKPDFEEAKLDNPELTLDDYLRMERAGMAPDMEARLRYLLANNGMTHQDDILYGEEMPLQIRMQMEQLGGSVNETAYQTSMRNLGIDQQSQSLVSRENLQANAPYARELIDNNKPTPTAPRLD